MAIEYHLPSKWDDLNEWQMWAVSKLFKSDLTQSNIDFLLICVFVLDQKSFKNFCRLGWFLWKVNLIEIVPTLAFIHKQSTRTIFPAVLKIKNTKLIGPAPRMGNVTMEEFGLAIPMFNRFNSHKEDIDLIRLVSILYRPSGFSFSRYNLNTISDEVEKMDINKLYPVFLAFAGSLDLLANRFPMLFPKKTNRNTSYNISYESILMDVASVPSNPFGNIEKVRKATITDFFNYLEKNKSKK
ncbi:MAG: hypothetical protein ACPGSD_00135 [Flavobacteriales bacterium]